MEVAYWLSRLLKNIVDLDLKRRRPGVCDKYEGIQGVQDAFLLLYVPS